MMLGRLSDHLKSKYDRKDYLSRQLQIVKVFDIYKDEIKKLFPNERQIKPVSLKNKILTVEAGSAAMANELRFREKDVTGKINKALGGEIVRRIVYRF